MNPNALNADKKLALTLYYFTIHLFMNLVIYESIYCQNLESQYIRMLKKNFRNEKNRF